MNHACNVVHVGIYSLSSIHTSIWLSHLRPHIIFEPPNTMKLNLLYSAKSIKSSHSTVHRIQDRPAPTTVFFLTARGALQLISQYKWHITLAYWPDLSLPISGSFYIWMVWGNACCKEPLPRTHFWLSTARTQTQDLILPEPSVYH